MSSRNQRYLFPVMLGIVISLFLVIYLLMFNYFSQVKEGIIQGYMDGIKNDYNITVDTYSRSTNLIFDRVINQEEVLKVFVMGVNARDPEEKDIYRKALYDQLQRFYGILQLYDFKQLQFHEKNNASFLRFHSPLKYGDNLTGYRATVEYVNYNNSKVFAFEGGRIINGYRFVFPLNYEGEHIGSVELSISIKAIVDHMEDSTGKKIQFILKKSGIERKVFESELNNFTPWSLDSRYVLDNSVISPGFDSHIPASVAEAIRSSIDLNSDTSAPFAFEGLFDGVRSVYTFIPVTNLLNTNVAYLICVSDADRIQSAREPFVLFSIVYLLLFVVLLVLALFYDRARRKMRQVLLTDHLTRLDNRHNLMAKMHEEFVRFIRYRGVFSVVILDIDHFKKINDTFGHLKGDDVLRRLSQVLKSNIRAADTVGRYGGEEFLVLLPETNLQDASVVAENLRKKIEEAPLLDDWPVTVSMGVAESNPRQKSIETLVDAADRKLYEAKNAGRNRVCF